MFCSMLQKVIDVIKRIVMTISSTSLLLFIYYINQNDDKRKIPFLSKYPAIVSCIFFAIVIVLFALVSLIVFLHFQKASIEGNIHNIEMVNNTFLPTYLGYFFVALSIQNLHALFIVYIIVCIFTYPSQSPYVNPLFLLFGYKFYYITTTKCKRVLIVSNRDKMSCDIIFPYLHRINSFTFIENCKEKKR